MGLITAPPAVDFKGIFCFGTERATPRKLDL